MITDEVEGRIERVEMYSELQGLFGGEVLKAECAKLLSNNK